MNTILKYIKSYKIISKIIFVHFELNVFKKDYLVITLFCPNFIKIVYKSLFLKFKFKTIDTSLTNTFKLN